MDPAGGAEERQSAQRAPGAGRIPRSVWALGLVSLLMDSSSEMIHSLLPVFLVSVLGASALSVGLVEGIAEATAAITKFFSGALSDRIGRRKPLVLFGYGLAALTKPAFALAPDLGWVIAARFTDRLGKGIRGAPRDALIGDVTPPELRGASFGLRQSLDTVGAIAGPLLALGLMYASGDDYRLVFWAAGLPALLAVLVILVWVREPESHRGEPRAIRLSWREVRRFPAAYWAVVGVAAAMTLARFSEGFLLLRAQSVGLADALVPAILLAMNLVYAASSYPVGRLSDRLGRRGLLLAGFGLLAAADLVLAGASGVAAVVLGALLWGLHLGMTQGLLAALVADAAPPALRGAGFGLFHLASGVALLAASLIAGWLWTLAGPGATFLAGAAFAAVALAALALLPAAWR
ncbi:Predicted arabinose efflux permease, MFS family [Tistlia consotensis]|uniref:Predicted arabinose efflux permease, MFS family n=1 Tax=Tistlia consotensis USBA 355 TaxID=560819 RepID=A0A1Y6BKC6_9PROT|nr:MFS transporter [Tistlia consotensis]SMF14416.1 Predicted arabinose efflux permease, MFS family [Tistlia consotensis USBA 355]SNR49562.1 Predicted arabinose efflux permease, MFS family [Tistlia consotensis]